MVCLPKATAGVLSVAVDVRVRFTVWKASNRLFFQC